MRLFLLFIFISFTKFNLAQGDSILEFAQVYYEGDWRIINKKGDFMLNQKYGVGSYQCLCFGDRLAISFKDNKVGFTDFNNNQIIPNKYDQAECFVLGFAAVSINGKCGIINREDKFIVEPIYEYAGSFGLEGLAGVIKDGMLGFVDTSGKLVIPCQYYWFPSFNVYPKYPIFTNGLIAVIKEIDLNDSKIKKLGFMNRKGELIISPKYDVGNIIRGMPMFFNGVANVSYQGKSIIIDTTGKEIVESEFKTDRLIDFQSGYETIYSEEGYQGIINKSGKIILEPKYNSVGPFIEGFAAIQIKDTIDGVVSGFIDTTGKFVFSKRFQFIKNFHKGLAIVQINNKWGFIDTSGDFSIKPIYDFVEEFHDGLAIAAVRKGKSMKYGFINKNGDFVIKPIYEELHEFRAGLAPAKIKDKFGYIDLNGKIVIKPKFDNAFSFQQEYLGY